MHSFKQCIALGGRARRQLNQQFTTGYRSHRIFDTIVVLQSATGEFALISEILELLILTCTPNTDFGGCLEPPSKSYWAPALFVLVPIIVFPQIRFLKSWNFFP